MYKVILTLDITTNKYLERRLMHKYADSIFAEERDLVSRFLKYIFSVLFVRELV